MTTVLVTGASGFIAKHIVRELLDNGYVVRASTRSNHRRDELDALFPDAGLEHVTLDLNHDEGWADALADVDVLMHTASPFPGEQPDDPEDLIRPAVDGTLRALEAARAAGVNRVILTSSVAAVLHDPAASPTATINESNWTDPEGERVSAYEASKTLAERAAWDFAATHTNMKITVINPAAVMGPALDGNYG
ncbi:MAG: NAD-dependent epimerase/dehydratase family protein, partial [Acidimicrobiaceae bacterium]